MGGSPKGLLLSEGEPLLARAIRVARALGHEVVLVGRAEAYAEIASGCEALDDVPEGVGPLGGLGALLARAEMRALHAKDAKDAKDAEDAEDAEARVIALACDLPYLRSEPLRALESFASGAAVVAARRAAGAPWEPLFARYDARRVRPALAAALEAGERSFQRLFARLEVEELPLDEAAREALVDWDEPADLARGRLPA